MDATAETWLALQCRMIADATHGLVLRRNEKDALVSAAVWPSHAHCPGLADAAARAAQRRTALVHRLPRSEADGAAGEEGGDPAPPLDAFAYPLTAGGEFIGVAAVAVPSPPESQRKAITQLMRWGAAWLEFRLDAQSSGGTGENDVAVELLALALQQPDAHAATTACVTELAARLGCDRVSVGLLHKRSVRVSALSHSADVTHKSSLVRAIGNAMEEAVDQETTIVFPAALGTTPVITRAHDSLARSGELGAICTIPLAAEGELIGAMTLERSADRPFDEALVEQCECTATLLGPVVRLMQERDRWLPGKAWDSARRFAGGLLGPSHLAWKVAGIAGAVAAAWLTLATGSFEITARATLEPSEQRVVVAARQGFIVSASARAGDVVSAGQTLAELDRKELELERVKWSSRREQLRKQYRAALADRDRGQRAVLQAQIRQTEAELDLVEESLAHTHVKAPFDGIVVHGDLSQSLGAPVAQGDVLFKVAPLEAYRVVLEVDERDIAEARPGQAGHLVLSGLPSDTMPIEVKRVLPLSTAADGRNFFKVDAELGRDSDRLRPGMEGVAKVHVDERSLAWIWGHQLVDWLRLQWWTWT